jgi:ankyrin repeat protein
MSLLMASESFMGHDIFYDPYTVGPYDQKVTKVHMAVYFGLTDLVEDLLRAGFEIDRKDRLGRTPLSYSAELGWETTVSLLVNGGAEVDSLAFEWRLNEGRTPLSYAAKAGHEGVTQILLNNGASPTSIDFTYFSYGMSPLLYAAMSGNEGVVRLLLDKYIEIDCQDQDQEIRESCDGSEALAIAARYGYERIARLLVEHASNPDVRTGGRNQTPLSMAAERGDEAIVRLLLDKRRVSVDSLNIDGCTPLWYAARKGRIAVVRRLLGGGADINLGQYPMKSPIAAAAEAGHYEVVQLLLEKGANPDGDVSTGRCNCVAETLHMTSGWNKLTHMESCHERTPLSYMSEKGHESVVRLFLEKGAGVDSTFTKPTQQYGEGMGRTPLSFAAEKGHENFVQLLIMKGANINSKSDNTGLYGGRTPLSFAAENGHEVVVRLLLESEKVDPDSEDCEERTPLSYAAEKGHEGVIRLLLERDEVDPDSVDRRGRTPLYYAVKNGNKAVVWLLLGKAVDVHKRSWYDDENQELTPLEYAQSCGHEEIVQILTENGASKWENE